MPPFITAIQFAPSGPRVTGYWETEPPATRKWVEWLGLYGVPGTSTVITLVEQRDDGSERSLKRWPDEPPAGSGHRIA
ncbi:hypothetical protein [Streptomyces sp. NPDC091259]|uniref:hypothetical protein n=1 Tax=Streptomyces sp. NPDC091259 TaxID=3365976 RepID=UPI0038257571